MSIIAFDLPPIQKKFTEEDVRVMRVGRRQIATQWESTAYPPVKPDDNWRLVLPFPNTYENAFFSMCDLNAHPYHSPSGKLVIFLNGTAGDAELPKQVTEWLATVEKLVAIKDHLALSFALDYERLGGNPDHSQTKIGELRSQAKPYGESVATTPTKEAADELVQHFLWFLDVMICYKSANCVVAMPPSDPSKPYNLPRYLAEQIAKNWSREDLTKHVRTIATRNSIKGVPLAEKLDTLRGTIQIDSGVFAGRNVLLIDDLYQSGVSMNYCGFLLLQAGAKKIFGLACEKTCRNDDNVSGTMSI